MGTRERQQEREGDEGRAAGQIIVTDRRFVQGASDTALPEKLYIRIVLDGSSPARGNIDQHSAAAEGRQPTTA